MPTTNEAYHITLYQREREDKLRVHFHGVNFGYAGNPVLLKQTPRLFLVKKLPTRDWSGLGMTSYYGPELSVAVRVPGSMTDSRSMQGCKDELIVVVWDQHYDRTTRKAIYAEAEKVMAKHEAMPEPEIMEIVRHSRSFYANVITELAEIKKRLGDAPQA